MPSDLWQPTGGLCTAGVLYQWQDLMPFAIQSPSDFLLAPPNEGVHVLEEPRAVGLQLGREEVPRWTCLRLRSPRRCKGMVMTRCTCMWGTNNGEEFFLRFIDPECPALELHEKAGVHV